MKSIYSDKNAFPLPLLPKAIPIAEKNKPGGLTRSRLSALRADTARFKKGYLYTSAVASKLGPCSRAALMNPLMILVKIIKLRWIHILSYDQMVSRKI
ncbi:hypothetical protein, partial [Klebsiella pneumoniae]|uniref:hypothetical protein n=1 Tax=Klebsiella pneumoniae TaxID=573 RepID=UPI001C6E1BC8